jgi:sugar O-acyltransferase (sialic acid O-acetyltransferase NeuD family)
MNTVVVVGGGGQGRQVIDAIEHGGRGRVVGVLDDALSSGTTVAGHRVLDSAAGLGACAARAGATAYVVAIGSNFDRAAVMQRLDDDRGHLVLATVVHPAASVARDAMLGEGSIVLAGAVVANGCTLGRGVLLGSNSSIDHDGLIGDFASLAPGATVAGTVQIGARTALGVGANVVHRVTIGADTVVGAGALVLDDLPDGVVAYGVPTRVVRTRETGERYL